MSTFRLSLRALLVALSLGVLSSELSAASFFIHNTGSVSVWAWIKPYGSDWMPSGEIIAGQTVEMDMPGPAEEAGYLQPYIGRLGVTNDFDGYTATYTAENPVTGDYSVGIEWDGVVGTVGGPMDPWVGETETVYGPFEFALNGFSWAWVIVFPTFLVCLMLRHYRRLADANPAL